MPRGIHKFRREPANYVWMKTPRAHVSGGSFRHPVTARDTSCVGGRNKCKVLSAQAAPPLAGGRKDRIPMIMDRIALIITIIGALNWGSIGLFQFDLVAWICGGASTVAARIIYSVVALAGIWCISLLFRARESFESVEGH